MDILKDRLHELSGLCTEFLAEKREVSCKILFASGTVAAGTKPFSGATAVGTALLC